MTPSRSLLAIGLLAAPLAAARAQDQVRISLNSLGYLSDAPKCASVVGAAGDFTVERAPDGAVVVRGTLAPPRLNPDTGERVAVADFSALAAPGSYRLVVAGASQDANFQVAPYIYRRPFAVVMRGMHLWRCGAAVACQHDGVAYAHGPCHLEDAYLDVVGGGHVRRPSVGGWHDAGDYNKYVVNAAAAVGPMLRAWHDFQPQIEAAPLDLPALAGPLPPFLAELKWELDWLLTMQADDGSVYHKLSTREFGGFVPPEEDRELRFFLPWSTAATADFVAMLSAAAGTYRPYDPAYADACLAAAKKSRRFLLAHPEERRAQQQGFATGAYDSSDADDRLWADAEYWAATGESAALATLESRLAGGDGAAHADVNWDWPNLKTLGLLTYLFADRSGRDPNLVATVRDGVLAAANAAVAAAADHGYARPLGATYYWGANGTVARQSLVLQAAYRLTGDAKYRDASLDALNHLFGRNYFARSFVTGLGRQPPLYPHDRRSASDAVAAPWPGYLVGGPEHGATDWRDEQDDYRTNEIAINWNGALLYALAAHLPQLEQ